jgi:long-subunit acyl-CoA synthetase (AMP-forming)
MLVPERGHAMKLMDRRGHLLKLNNGKFVTPYRLQQSYKNFEGIKNIWIYGWSLQGFILAVCNVYKDKYLEIAKRVGLDFDGDIEKALRSEEAHKAFLEYLQKNVEAGNKRIMDFQIVKGIIIEPENFLKMGMYTENG